MARSALFRWTVLAGGALALAACVSTAPPPAGVSAEAMALHQRLLTLDTHLDTPMAFTSARGFDIMAKHDVHRDGSQVDLPRMKAGGLDGGFWVIYFGQGALTPEAYRNARDDALLRAMSIHEVAAANPGDFEIATRSGDAARIAAQGKRVAYLAIENSWPLGEDLSLVQTFYKLGVRMIGPVHNGNNQFADSANPGANPPVTWNGLSPLGRELVKEANRLGMIIDGSHSSDIAIEQLIDLSATPIILSHHGADGLYEHPRNLPDATLKKLADKGGVIHVNALGSFLKPLPQSPERTSAITALREKYGNPGALSAERYETYLDEMQAINATHPENRATFDDYMEQVLYIIKLLGVDHVGFGADWDGGGGVEGMRDVSDLPKVTARLLAEGYSESDLQKMWSGNVLRLLKTAEDYAAAR